MPSTLKILLMQPNYGLLGKRTWEMPPYGLALLNACLAGTYDCRMFDPNFRRMGEAEITSFLAQTAPDIVGITSSSTEYMAEVHHHARLVKEALPSCRVILGGAYPTVLPERAIADPNVDFCVIGEGERRLPRLLEAIEGGEERFDGLEGIAHKVNGVPVIIQPEGFIDRLDAVPFPDYGNLDLLDYGNHRFTYAHYLVPRQYPFAMTLTSRGCPYGCIFCAAKTVSGTKVRLRSSASVLAEVEMLCDRHGMREIVFLDDHFLFDRDRAKAIAVGIRERDPGLTWKCSNVAIWSLTGGLLETMRETGCYQLTLSIESGVQEVLRDIVRKPVHLQKSVEIIQTARALGYEIITNFVIGFPGETWDQIRQTIDFAQRLDVDLVNFHIATPLPKTRLMELVLEQGLLGSEDEILSGYTKGMISTEEFSATDLQILRAYEWDRINFRSKERMAAIARMEGLTLEEAARWRLETRRSLGTTLGWSAKGRA